MVDRQVLIGQLTDTHVVADGVTAADTTTGIDNNGRLRSAVASILAEPAPLDAVVVTGDLVNDARVEEYDTAVELLAPLAAQRGPGTPASVGNRLLPIPGNHDRPGELRRRFPNVPWADTEHTSWVTDVGGVRLIGLDSTRVRAGVVEHGGAVDADRLDWLDRVLGIAHDGPTVLAMHHPPFASGIWWMDRWGFEGLDLLAEVLADRAIERIMCGHLHRPMSSMFAGAVAEVGMSTAQHVGLDLVADRDVTVSDSPAGYQILQVRPFDGHVGPASAPRMVLHHRHVSPSPVVVEPEWAGDVR